MAIIYKSNKKFDKEKLTMENFDSLNINSKTILESKQKVKDNKKSKKISIIMLIVNILIVALILLYNLTQNEDFKPLNTLNFDFRFLTIIIIITFLTILIDSIITNLFISQSKNKSNMLLGYKSFSIMKYYDSITPMGAGGQPFMATYLISKGIQSSKSVSIPVKKFLTQQFSWLIVTSIGLIYTIVNRSITNPLIVFFAIFGFSINLFLDLFILIASSSEKITKGVSKWFIRFLTKIKIIKDYDKAMTKTLKFMSEYQEIMKDFSDNKRQFWSIILFGIIRNMIYFSIPFFIYCCFRPIELNLFFVFFTFAIMVELSGSCFPLPGGSGMNEITFSVLFNQYLPDAVFWAMLLWRLFSYYLYIIQGIVIMAIDLIFASKKQELYSQ